VKFLAAFSAIVTVATNSALAQQPRHRESEKSSGVVATLPLAADAGAAVLVSVSLNGSASDWWAVDSGASECIVDRSLARKAKLITRGGRDLRGAGKGTVRLDSIRSSVALRLGGKPLPTCDHFGAVDLGGLAGNGARPIAGILGYEFFSRYVVRIDFAAHTLTLYDPTKYRYAGNGETIQLFFDRRQPSIDVHIRTAHRPQVIRRLLVDTGSEDAVDDISIRRSSRAPEITVATTGLGASYEAAIGTLDTVQIGRFIFTNLPGVASDIGLVGNGVWSRFVCVFDFARKRLIIETPKTHRPAN
jgi:hypothetical protein